MTKTASKARELASSRLLLIELEANLNATLPEAYRASFAEETMTIRFQNQELETFGLVLSGALDAARLFSVTRKISQQESGRPKLLVARYISAPARKELSRQGFSFLDATGNASIIGLGGKLLIIKDGLERDPWRTPGRPALSFQGSSVQAITRYLVENKTPIPISRLIADTQVPRGSVYRALQLLESHELITRNGSQIADAQWEELLISWTDETGFSHSGFTKSYSLPGGIDQLEKKLRSSKLRYVATGTIASMAYHQSASLAAAMLYSFDPDGLALDLGLEKPTGWANVLINFPKTDLPFRDSVSMNGIQVASVALTYRDLMSGPGRNPEEAKNLLDWMKRNVELWRK